MVSPFASDWLAESSPTPPKLASPSLDCPSFVDELCSPPKLEYECPSSEVLLHIAYEVVSQLDRALEFIRLSPEEHSLRDFLEDHITSL
jgi:hypothetical protein